jgi:enoyl-CoA hydratase/carnithine racemase
MGISQGGTLRIVTERTKMAMPETAIGLFPDVGGGYFLSRCPGHAGEWLALTGDVIGAADALDFGLADGFLPSDQQPALWDALAAGSFADAAAVEALVKSQFTAPAKPAAQPRAEIDRVFALPTVAAMVEALEAADGEWAQHTAATLRKRSPLMLHVVLEQIRRARGMTLAQDLRMERDMCATASTCARARARPSKAYAPWPWTRTTARAGTRRASRMCRRRSGAPSSTAHGLRTRTRWRRWTDHGAAPGALAHKAVRCMPGGFFSFQGGRLQGAGLACQQPQRAVYAWSRVPVG